MEINAKFNLDKYDLMCVEFNGDSVDWKLGEFFSKNGIDDVVLEFEEVDFLNEIHQTNLISEELLKLAMEWYHQQSVDAEVIEQIKLVKESIAKICQQKLEEHECTGVIPDTFIMCGEDALNYCSEECLNIAKAAKQLDSKYIEQINKALIDFRKARKL